MSAPCTPWIALADARSCGCADDTVIDDATLQAGVDGAIEALYELSGEQFTGECTVKVRPRVTGCATRELRLPGPVRSLDTVTVDGVVLAAGVDYRLDPGGRLVRLGGNVWPRLNDMTLADTERGTWSILYKRGVDPPQLALNAAAELACELAKLCVDGQECRLDRRVVNVARQGITVTYPGLADALASGVPTGLPATDLFVATYNPSRTLLPAHVASPDYPPVTFRRVASS